MSRHYAPIFGALLTTLLMLVAAATTATAGTDADAQAAYRKGD
jgi:hypothetical protein